jgi:hypothetical protein
MVMDDLAVVLAYLERQWIPADVKPAFDRLRDAERWDLVDQGLGPSVLPMANGRFLKIQEDH